MASLAENRFVLSLAAWAWDADPSPLVTPAACLDSLPLLTSPCLARLVARGVGVGIILLSCVNRAPVIKNILASGSAAGLSASSVCGEIVMYSNAAFYNVLRGNPFTAYGETLTVLLQVMVVLSLIWKFSNVGRANVALALAAYAIYLFVVFQVLTPDTQYILMVVNPLVLVYSRGAQIAKNFSSKQTGAQSIITNSMNMTGSLVRMVTTIKEVGWDFHILRSYTTSVILNSILLAQIFIYKQNTENFLRSLKEKKGD